MTSSVSKMSESKLKLKDAGSDPLKQLELLESVTRLGSRWMIIQEKRPEAFSLMLTQLESL